MQRELLLLGLLRRGQTHGYQLNEFIERDLGRFIDLKKPTAYALLEKMEKQGWILQHTTQEGNRPPRRVYEITAKGEAQFQTLLRENLGSFSLSYFAGDVGLVFIDELPREEAIALLQERRTGLLADLEMLRGIPHHDTAPQLAIDHQIFHTESELRWLDSLIARLDQPA